MLEAYVHVHTRCKVCVIKPVGRRIIHRQWWMTDDDGQWQQCWAIHDSIGSLAWLPNEPVIDPWMTSNNQIKILPQHQCCEHNKYHQHCLEERSWTLSVVLNSLLIKYVHIRNCWSYFIELHHIATSLIYEEAWENLVLQNELPN